MHSNQKPSRLRFAWSHHRVELLVAVLIVPVLVGFIFLTKRMELKEWPDFFADWVDPTIAIGTFLAAIFIWFGKVNENWRRNLPKKLNILYLVDDGESWREHVTVYDAPLTGESDIRQWGQSIGQTIFPSEDSKGKFHADGKPIKEREWTSIAFTGFRLGSSRLERKRRVVSYDHVIFLKEEILGGQDGYSYVFDQYGAKWQAVAGTPVCNQAAYKRLKKAIPPYARSATRRSSQPSATPEPSESSDTQENLAVTEDSPQSPETPQSPNP